jgi:hypothetical protein
MPDLLREVTGVKPGRTRRHALLKTAGVRSTQRLGLGEVDSGIAALTWPAELVEQRTHFTRFGTQSGHVHGLRVNAGNKKPAYEPGLLEWSVPGSNR